uniref:hypothetical protein n=1 Tax=Segatella hominis TaxID=2518605 RepID=UPI00403897C2
MKNLKTLLTMAIVALMSLSFTSCDEDADIGDTLYGTWKGYMDIGLTYMVIIIMLLPLLR